MPNIKSLHVYCKATNVAGLGRMDGHTQKKNISQTRDNPGVCIVYLVKHCLKNPPPVLCRIPQGIFKFVFSLSCCVRGEKFWKKLLTATMTPDGRQMMAIYHMAFGQVSYNRAIVIFQEVRYLDFGILRAFVKNSWNCAVYDGLIVSLNLFAVSISTKAIGSRLPLWNILSPVVTET